MFLIWSTFVEANLEGISQYVTHDSLSIEFDILAQ